MGTRKNVPYPLKRAGNILRETEEAYMIPNEIAWETQNIIPINVLEDILNKLAAVFADKEGFSREGGKFRLHLKAETIPHLKVMKGLGLVEEKPICKKGRKRSPANQSADTYEITRKAWRWHALNIAKYGIGRG
ncbi:MAG: hypothetical protein UX02_C0001G0103 [Candidatus Moranbacteria bacterium GW2011_GWC1_45_18]|nr:MAG: hypothetical protein UT79_C0002G0294 [Candidatus Moranbacteria bacterium GW2011_GWC2_40_12]KKT34133.1 MAG: hypothetical protein UW19_C0001G0028 [Candidatus Moranbacteria bacterium GW2011_GWF2_44_10]KKU00655.1 MAG: hypothetical protein UX02_C0001G0103 [Candidatus Moranbacteria bacterium GW2011_GWC1_45_18]OGI23601.1 MAG: hypothetical protein A2194_02525 [Candidatus Moranbacteria bacterium RIFOXYA1_FULL_44_8]OGI36857.1 MAG: hypothetical protein A2407_01795 [Candidatus Moranbacteria bacteri